jgi:hypothetical protein
MRTVFFIALGVALAPGGPALGQQKPEPIKREQSRVWLEDVPGLAKAPVGYVYLGWTPNYSSERFYAQTIARGTQLPRLHVNYTMAAPGFVWLSDSALGEKYLKGWSFFKDREIVVPREHGGGSSGTITVPFRSADANCFAFLVRQVAMGTMGGSGANGRSSIDGFYCAAPGTTIDATLTHQVLASIRVTEDLSRVREPLVAPVATTPAITPPHIAAAAPAPNTPALAAATPSRPPNPPQVAASLPLVGWSAPPGTRFVTRSGFFEIVGVENGNTVTVNKSNNTGRWAGGLLGMRSRGSIEPNVIAQLQPIAVGKEVTFEEKGKGEDRWRYTIRVTGTETVTIKERSYQAFIIVARDQSLNPDQGGFDRTRTMWYSPQAGGILKQRVKQDAGPPVNTNSWEVVDIIPPGSGS